MADNKRQKWQNSDGFGKHSIHMGKNEGVYVISSFNFLTRTKKVVYVGRSLNLQERWKSHPVYNKSVQNGDCPYVKWKLCDNSAQLEMKLIKKFKPKYNKHGL